MNEARPTVDAVDDSLPAAPLEPADPRAERDWRASVAAGLNDTARYVMLERGRVVFEGGEEDVAGAPRAVSDFFDLDGAGVLA